LRSARKKVEAGADSNTGLDASQSTTRIASNAATSSGTSVRKLWLLLRAKAAALWLAWRGWSRLSFYSFDVAFLFLKAIVRIAPHLSPRELAHWTNCGIRLAKAEPKLARHFFHRGTDILLKVPASIRSRLLRVSSNTSYIYRGDSLRNGFRAAMALAAGTTDYELGARIMDVAINFGKKSFGYTSLFLQTAAEIILRSYDGNPFQRALFMHSVEVAAQMPAKFALDLFSALSPFIKAAGSEGPSANTTLIVERLLQHTEEVIPKDDEGASQAFLCGLEFVPLGNVTLIDKWARLCQKFLPAKERSPLQANDSGPKGGKPSAIDIRKQLAWHAGPLVNFTEHALEPTKLLVSLAQGSRKDVCAAVLDAAIEVIERDAMAAANCYTTSPSLLRRMSLDAYREWIKHGLAAFADPDRLAAYFAAESRASQEAINQSADTLQLQKVARVLSSYVKMLTGRELPLEPRTEKYDVVEPASGESIVLPPAIAALNNAEDRFRLYKTLAAQAAGQIEFGTYESGSNQLQSLGAELIEHFPRLPSPKLNGNTDWQTLISLFPQTTIARRLFTILENARIEFRLGQQYKGLRRDLEFARSERRRIRPPDQYVMKYEPLLEQLFIEALGDRETMNCNDDEFQLTQENAEWLNKVREVLHDHIQKTNSSVADTLRACLVLYTHLNPAAPETSMPWEDPNVKPDHQDPKSSKQQERAQTSKSSGEQIGAGAAVEQNEVPALEFERTAKANKGESLATASKPSSLADVQAENTYYYDEWDCRIGDYRPRWSRVVESEWRSGDLIFARRTHAAYRGLLSQVRYQFQLLAPVGLRRINGQTDGDELDLQAITDLVIDRHAHSTPSERIYSQRQHRERDVAVCFLIDMSGSTNARVNGGKHVLDIEKEALLLMSEALEAVGDAYAIYGFSSSGRRTTSVYRFKTFGEQYGEQVERRIGAAHSLVNTRLGVAIRHATFRLNQQPSATRLLIILSDARPADEDYGSPYAYEDTRVALQEGRSTGVTNFFITFDQGERRAEMERMLEGTNFTIIDDIQTLPERMPVIYRKLTT
jgi:nitric oxide reductase NorD protein